MNRVFRLVLGLAILAAASGPALAMPHDGLSWVDPVILVQDAVPYDTTVTDTVAASATPDRHRSFKDLKPAKDMWRGVKVAGGDAMAVVTGPFHMDGSDAMWTLAALGATGIVYAYDQEILDAFHRNDDAGAYDALVEPGHHLEELGLIGTTAPYWATGLAIGYLMRWDTVTQVTSEVLESHLITGVLRQIIEQSVGRTRPTDGKGPYNFEFREGDSFPSGHASVVFEVATVASYHTRSNWLRALYYSVATAVSLQRVDSNEHWPSDIIAGACIGTLVARTIVRRHAAARAAGR
ncbi:MAG TPA: phosphatase PAP2 family protein [Candidatus Eisenbacteria bacterium]|nr:phosphatase PAP2 family protein [Candidatus Eisenbacteria bacterium]